MMWFQLFCLLCLTFASIKAERVKASESDLRRHLFQNYDKLVRPVKWMTDTIPILVNLFPVGIRDVDVKDREIKFDAILYMKWEDNHLTWDKTRFPADHLVLPADQVWRPDVSIYSAVSDKALMPTVMTNVYIIHNGTVIWVPPITVKSRCPPTENQITLDTFQCTISMGSWTYDVGQLDIKHQVTNILEEGDDMLFHNMHPKWILESMTASTVQNKHDCCTELWSLITYDMRFRKRSGQLKY